MAKSGQTKISDLYACLSELHKGASIDNLCAKYNSLEVLAAKELLQKDVSLGELKDFQDRRANALKEATHHIPSECRCGRSCYDLAELSAHLEYVNDRRGHGYRPGAIRVE